MPSEGLKLTIDVQELNDKLKQSMKNLGALYDDYGRLVGKEKQYIGTLSQTQIRMGDYIDAQGKMRNAHNFCIDGLTRTQQALRMFRDELGNVYSAEGDLIEISNQRIKALDAEGQKVVEEKEKWLRAEREKYGDSVEEVQKYLKVVEAEIKKIEEESAARKRSKELNEAFGKSLSAIGGMAGNLSQVAAILGQTGEGAGKAAKLISSGSQALQVFITTSEGMKGVIASFKTLKTATEAQAAAHAALNLVSMNWISLLAGGISAAVAGFSLYESSAKKASNAIEREEKKVDELTSAYKRLSSTRLNSAKAEEAGAVAAGLTENEILEERRKKVEELTREYQKSGQAYIQAQRAAADNAVKEAKQVGAAAKYYNAMWLGLSKQSSLNRAEKRAAKEHGANREELEKANTELANEVMSQMKKDMASDPLKELKDRANEYAKLLEKEGLDDAARANIQAALAENERKQADLVDKKNKQLAEEKGYGDFLKKKETEIVQPETQAELDAAIKKAAQDLGEGSETYKTVTENMKAGFEAAQKEQAEKRLADAEKALGDKFQAYADGSALWTAQEKAAHDLQATIEEWTENFADAGRSQAELDAAIVNLKQEYKDKQLQEFLSANDLKIKETEKLDAEAQYTETLKKIREAEETYGLQAAEAEKLRAQATEELADARMKKAEEERQQRESRLSELGITGLREQMKSPFEKMMEQQMKIQQAQAEGLISAAESNQLQAKLTADYWQQNAQQTESGERETGFEREEYKAASSLTAGSNELYQAMTQRESSTERYQTGVTKNLGNMARYSEENYETLQAIQANLASVMQTLGVV